MTLVKFNPENKRNALMPGFSDVFDSIFNDTFFADRMLTKVPAANISETSDHYHIEMAAPGLKKEDFKLKLESKVLSISVEKHKEEKHEERNYAKREYSYSSFIRSFTLPESANENGIQATYNDGILTIDIPKREESKVVSRQIEIK
jgi:HSP20 family protein